MRFKIFILCVLCAFCGSTYAALNANTVWEIRTTGAQTNGGGFRWLDLRNSTYSWTLSGGGTNEYYCRTAAGGNPSLTEAKCATTDGTFNLDGNGTLGSLTAGQWDWGDNDTLGYSTVYVRLDTVADPDTKPVGFVQIGNGGGYDYTQQAAAQLSLTDLASTQASSWLTLTSATGGFTSLMVGNVVRIASGTNFTADWYEITAYTNGNTVTVDRACGATGDASAGSGKVGGAFLLGGTLDDEFGDIFVAGHRICIMAGTYTPGEVHNWSGAGTDTTPINIEGYGTVRADAPAQNNRPLIDMAAYNAYWYNNYSIVRNLRFTGTSSAVISTNSGNGGALINCRFHNTSVSAGQTALLTGSNRMVISCEAISDNGTAISPGSSDERLINCYIHDSVTGYNPSTGGYALNCIFDTCTTGVSLAGVWTNTLISNTIYNCTTGISATTCTVSLFINNIISGCTTGASWTTLTGSNIWDYNCWNNTTDVSNVTKGPNDITANPLLNAPATGDFTLQAGSPCLDAGLQIGANQGAVGDYKFNIGVDQDDNAAAAGGGATMYMGNF